MKSNHLTFFIVFLFVCVILGGCFGPAMPDGMPKLMKNASIKVIQDGAPLADAHVRLVSLDSSMTWTVGGTTDQAGIAALVTHGQYPGAPAGRYKVVVVKQDRPVSKIDATGMSYDELKAAEAQEDRTAYDLVEPSFGLAKKTTLEAELSESSPQATVDVGKAVRAKIIEN